MAVKQGDPPRNYTLNQDEVQDLVDSLNTTELTDPQKCGNILSFFLQKKIIKSTLMSPNDVYIRDGNAAKTVGGGSINMNSAQRKG